MSRMGWGPAEGIPPGERGRGWGLLSVRQGAIPGGARGHVGWGCGQLDLREVARNGLPRAVSMAPKECPQTQGLILGGAVWSQGWDNDLRPSLPSFSALWIQHGLQAPTPHCKLSPMHASHGAGSALCHRYLVSSLLPKSWMQFGQRSVSLSTALQRRDTPTSIIQLQPPTSTGLLQDTDRRCHPRAHLFAKGGFHFPWAEEGTAEFLPEF